MNASYTVLGWVAMNGSMNGSLGQGRNLADVSSTTGVVYCICGMHALVETFFQNTATYTVIMLATILNK